MTTELIAISGEKTVFVDALGIKRKTCTQCGLSLSLPMFRVIHPNGRPYRMAECRICTNARCENLFDPARNRANAKAIRRRVKAEVLAAYGGVCSCCGESNLELLTIEHIGKTGKAHRASVGGSGGLRIYRDLKKKGYPAGYTVYCMSCNWVERFGSTCPHKEFSVWKLQ